MSVTRFTLQKSLNGLPYLGGYSGYQVTPFDWSKFIVNEQSFDFIVYGLKPGTPHSVFLNDLDVTSLCKQQGKKLGEGLVTPALGDVRNIGVGLRFTFYFKSGVDAITPVEKAAAQSLLAGGSRVLNIRNTDNTSKASVKLELPKYALNEPTTVLKKNPQVDNTNPKLGITYTEIAKGNDDNEYFFTPGQFSWIQTFYADSDIAQGSRDILLTSVDLYFKTKPDRDANISGNPGAGVTIALCEVENDRPIISKTISSSLVYKDYNQIFSFGDASSPTTFGFKQPIKITGGKFYGIVVMFEDPGYELWVNKTGDKLVNTNIPSPGVNSNKDGKLYRWNSSSIFTALNDTDIKFTIRHARTTTSDNQFIFVNNNYEFLTVAEQTGNFVVGEYVWQNTSPITGTVQFTQGNNTITGVGTDFSVLQEDQQIVLVSGNQSQVTNITEIVNSSIMIVSSQIETSNNSGVLINTVTGKIVKQDRTNNTIFLNNSTANSVIFTSNSIIRGTDSNQQARITSIDNISIDRLRLRGDVKIPTGTSLNVNVKAASKTGNSFVFSESKSVPVNLNNQRVVNITDIDAYILSRSNELLESNLYSNNDLRIDKKSIKIEANVVGSANNSFVSPLIEKGLFDIFSIENKISNRCDIIEDGITIDSEVAGNGIAISKHTTIKVPFDRAAEDVRMFMTAYRPQGTELRCYARIHKSSDPEPFDDKNWSPLEYVRNGNKYSSSEDQNNFIEYELGFPAFSETSNTIPGTFTATFGSDEIVVTNPTLSDITNNIANNEVIRIYNPLQSTTNYQVAVVSSANSTHINLASLVSTTNINGPGMRIDKLKYPQSAFNNINNNNITRYYNSDQVEFDGFETMQIKIVMLSDTSNLSPVVDHIQVYGVSA